MQPLLGVSHLQIGVLNGDWAGWLEKYCNALFADSKQVSSQLSFTRFDAHALADLEQELTKADCLLLPLKDLPNHLEQQSFKIGGVTARDHAQDVLIKYRGQKDESLRFGLPLQAIVGTGSKRRRQQLLQVRNDLRFTKLKGTLLANLEELRKGNVDALCVSLTLVECLQVDLTAFDVEKLDVHEFVPYPGQGVFAAVVSNKAYSPALQAFLAAFNHQETEIVCLFERKVQSMTRPHVAVYGRVTNEELPVYQFWGWCWEEEKKRVKQVYTTGRRPLQAAEALAAQMNAVHAAPVFISRNQKRNDYFVNALKDFGFATTSLALIDMNRIELSHLPAFDWIFFSSKHAVFHFFEQQVVKANIADWKHVKIGALGKATAEAVRKYGRRAEFIGYSTDTKLTGKQFAAIAGDAKVLFPIAKGSMRTVQQQFTKPSQVIDAVVYETKRQMPDAAFDSKQFKILIFTSPSNVEAWFERFKISADQRVIAFGEATANALRNFKVNVDALPATFDDLGLVQTVMGLN